MVPFFLFFCRRRPPRSGVDKRTFVYCDKAVYHIEQHLYQLIKELAKSGFVQISKSCLVNINMVESIRQLFNSRME
ncbi:MAG: LytTR family transcriptional regulator DNA-binding domain-containing protein, partial [Treponema sp.]|nr:LytTR family transcriptional regulator DNA-binding domain-containing protein [Treponema sp.]